MLETLGFQGKIPEQDLRAHASALNCINSNRLLKKMAQAYSVQAQCALP